MKKKLLFVIYAFKPFANANSNVAMPVINKLAQQYDVDVLTLNNDNTAKDSEVINRVTVHRYRKQRKVFNYLHILYYFDYKKDRGILRNIAVHIMHYISCALHIIPLFQHSEYVLLKKLIKSKKYDEVITTCESFLSCYHMMMLKKKYKFGGRWISYFMDPYATYYKNAGSRILQKQELDVYESCDLILTTEELYRANQTNFLSDYIYKTTPVRYTSFQITADTDNKTYESFFIQGKINCVYAGSFINDDVRDPRYFFKFISYLSDEYAFHIIVSHVSPNQLRKYKKMTESFDNVYWYDTMPAEKCRSILCSSDVLINIGNKVTNQTPSKILEYIGTGRPIVNFCSIDNDTSKVYLDRYQFAISLSEKESDFMENAKLFSEFCHNYNGCHISSEKLKQLYPEYDQDRVTDEIVSLL